jgi:Na+/melibiose symporter-like transporter
MINFSASGFDARYCQQPPAVELTLRILMGAVPGGILIISTICLYFYSIDDQRAKEIQVELQNLRYE